MTSEWQRTDEGACAARFSGRLEVASAPPATSAVAIAIPPLPSTKKCRTVLMMRFL